MPLSKVWAGSLVLLAAVSLPLHAASPVKVGSKIDTEGALLGNIILQVLESHGVPTVNKVQLGTTPVVRGAITSGELDIYPEYTGNGANGTVATASLRQPRCKNIAATECQHCCGRTGCQKSGCRLPETKRVDEVISRDLFPY